MNNEDDLSESMIAELRSCSEHMLYFAERYMPDATAEQQLLLWDALFNPGNMNVALYPTIRMARESMAKVMACFEDLPAFLKTPILYQTTCDALFDNGSSLVFRIGRKAHIQGRSITNLAIAALLTKTEHAELRPHVDVHKASGTRVHWF